MKKLLVLGLLVYGAYLLTLQAPMLGLLWIVLLYLAGFNFILFLLVLGIRSLPVCRRLQGRHETVD